MSDLANQAGGTPILFCNNAAVARDGTVFFTDSSNRFPVSHWSRDLLEHRPNGRRAGLRPGDGRTDVVGNRIPLPQRRGADARRDRR